MKCPICKADTRVLETRRVKADPHATSRRHECFNMHIFKTIERVELPRPRKPKQ